MPDIFDRISEQKSRDIFDVVEEKQNQSKSMLDIPFKVGSNALGVVAGAGEVTANLATQFVGLPAMGYGKIADLATDVYKGDTLGTSSSVSDSAQNLIYNPQTEYGKAGMNTIASLFDWWNEKTTGVGEEVQKFMEPKVGPEAAANWGASAATILESAPLFLGEAYGKGKAWSRERALAKDYAEIKTKLSEEASRQKAEDLSRANLGEVIPEDPTVAAKAREAATVKSGMDVFDRISAGYLGDEIPNIPPQRTPYEEWVMESEGKHNAAWEELGTEVADRIDRGYLGEPVTTKEIPKRVTKETPKEVKKETKPTRSVYPEDKVPDVETANNDISVLKKELKKQTDEASGMEKEGATIRNNPDYKYIKSSMDNIKSSIKALEKRKKELSGLLDNESGQAQAINDAARAIKEFFVPLSTVPKGKEYLSLRYKDLKGGIIRANRITKILSDRLKTLSSQDKKDAFNAIRGEIPVDTLPVELQKLVLQTRSDIDRVGLMLVKSGLMDRKTFDANRGNYIHYMYLRHILPDDVGVPMGGGGRLDLSYLKKRLEAKYPDMSPAALETIRQDLGLIEDISVAAPVGVGKALGDIVKTRFFKKVSENKAWVWQPSKELASLIREHKAYKQIVERGENVSLDVINKYKQLELAIKEKSDIAGKAPKDFAKIPDNPAYGELAGTLVRREIANDIIPVFRVSPHDIQGLARLWNQSGKVFDVSMTLFKVGKVALNPPTVFRNIMSNFIQINMSGVPLARLPDVVIDGVKSYKSKDNFFRTFERYGGSLTNFSVAELGEVLQRFEEARGGSIDKVLGSVSRLAKYYGKIDDIAKLALFKDAILNKGMSPADAMLHAQKWGMDYSLASRSVKYGRRYVLPFLSYQYKIAPLVAESLVKNPWVIGKYAAIPYLMAKSAAHMFDWSDKDLDKAQRLMAERTKHQGEYTLLPMKDNKGNVEILNLEYFLPWGNWWQTARDLHGGNYVDAAKQFGGILGPYGNVIAMLATKKSGEPPTDPFTGRPVYSKLDKPSAKYLKTFEWTQQLFGPSSLSSNGALGYTYKALTGEKDRWGTEATKLKAFGRWFGFNVGSLNYKQVVSMRKSKLRELDMEIHRIYRDPQYSKEDKKSALERLRIERRKILHPE